jgi:hypothetical protein
LEAQLPSRINKPDSNEPGFKFVKLLFYQPPPPEAETAFILDVIEFSWLVKLSASKEASVPPVYQIG